MVAKQTIHIHFVGGGGKCGAGSGAWNKGNGNANIGISEETRDEDDDQKLGDNGVAAASPVRTPARLSIDHVLNKRAKKEGKWNPSTRKFNVVTMLYVARPCSVCRANTRDYCSCDPGQDLCQVCFGRHLQEHGG